MKILEAIKDFSIKENFVMTLEFVLDKTGKGLKGISLEEIKTLGKITELIERGNSFYRYNDNRVAILTENISNSFKELISNENFNQWKDILAFYPLSVIDELIETYSDNVEIKKVRAIKALVYEVQDVSDFFKFIKQDKELFNKQITASINVTSLNNRLEEADKISKQIKEATTTRLEETLKKLKDKKNWIEDQINEITENNGPFLQSQYSSEQIQEWLKEIDDSDLLAFNEEESAQDIYEDKEMLNHWIKQGNNFEDMKNILREEIGADFIDVSREEFFVEREIVNIDKKEEKEVINNLEDLPIEMLEEKENSLEIDKEKMEEKYNQKDIVSKIKEEHKKGMSV